MVAQQSKSKIIFCKNVANTCKPPPLVSGLRDMRAKVDQANMRTTYSEVLRFFSVHIGFRWFIKVYDINKIVSSSFEYDELRYTFSDWLSTALTKRFQGGHKCASRGTNNEDMQKSFEMATEEQKALSQIPGFVKIVPQKKSRTS